MIIGAIQSVFGAPSVAILGEKNGVSVACMAQDGVHTDGARLSLGLLDNLLKSQGLCTSNIDAWAFCRGPAAFSGIRVGCAIAQGLAWAHEKPLIDVSSLALLAHKAGTQVAAIDARMGQVYLLKDGIERMLDYADLAHISASIALTDDTPDEIVTYIYAPKRCQIDAKDLASFAQKITPKVITDAMPVYLRDDAWKTIKEQGK